MTKEKDRTKEMIDFLYNPENILCCHNGVECPYDIDYRGGDRVDGPCGLQHCWVEVHCDQAAQYDEEEDV